MPYCCKCGNRTSDADLYCAACGAPQPVSGSGFSPRAASILCYIPVVGWVPAIIVLASQQFRSNREVRFHAFQGIYLFVAWLLVDWVVAPLHVLPFMELGPHFRGSVIAALLKLLVFVAWIVMLVKTSQGQMFKLPLLGELAERSVSEQAGR